MACSCASPRDPTARHFDERWARRELAAYRRGGPGRTTRRLLDGLRATNTGLGTVLDIGAGIGILTLGLLQAGARLAVCVDFSAASMAVGAEEARRLGVGDRIEWLEGDFTAIAPSVPPADVVTLDRVVCCYPEYGPLLEQAAAHCRRFLAMSYPRDRWYVRGALRAENAWRRFRGDPFRAFVHPVDAMVGLLRRQGFARVHRESTMSWNADIYARTVP